MPTVFVYGALMTHPEALARGEAAFVRDHAVRFTLRGLPFFEPAFAALEPEQGARAWGVVCEWSERAWASALRRERPYVARSVTVETKRGAKLDALALFVARFRNTAGEAAPSARYAALLLRGAEHHGFPEDVVARYRSLVERGPAWTRRLATLLGRP